MNKNKARYNRHSPEFKDAKTYVVKHEGELLDFLFETFPDKSNNGVKNLLTTRRVSIGGAPITQYNFKVYPGDEIIISKSPLRKKERSNLPIIYEDDEMIVINKPTKLLTVASDKEKGSTAFRMVTDYVQQKDKHNRVFIVHRIDEDTSGVLLMVKNAELQKAFQDDWNNLVQKRGYYAIVEGQFKEKSGTIKSYLTSNNLNLMYTTHKKGEGQLAITHYQVMKENKDYSLLDVNIDTGRKNQIRVQLGDKGHHVIGDDKYGEPKNPIGRLGLHAYELDIIHPFTKKVMKFKAPIPKDFNSLMDGTYVKPKREYNKKKRKK